MAWDVKEPLREFMIKHDFPQAKINRLSNRVIAYKYYIK